MAASSIFLIFVVICDDYGPTGPQEESEDNAKQSEDARRTRRSPQKILWEYCQAAQCKGLIVSTLSNLRATKMHTVEIQYPVWTQRVVKRNCAIFHGKSGRTKDVQIMGL